MDRNLYNAFVDLTSEYAINAPDLAQRALEFALDYEKWINDSFVCMDCKRHTMHTTTRDYYMIHDDLWESIVPRAVGMLCWACCSDRLGREITAEDLTDAPINDYHRKTI